MGIYAKLDAVHAQVKANKWFRYFANFNRVALAAGFLPSGFVKIMGERFTDLAIHHPMGHYLEALHYTGYYYTFIGIAQVLAAICLLVPRTASFGAVLYFPIILNICILSFAVRFEGSLYSAPLMVLANLYLLCWDYDKLKWILPFYRPSSEALPTPKAVNQTFPIKFFAGVLLTIIFVLASLMRINAVSMMPHNHLKDCQMQCKNRSNPQACLAFCACIHHDGQPLNRCLEGYETGSTVTK